MQRNDVMPKILVVEDNEENRDALSRRLQRRGFEVVIAIDGRAGVEVRKTEKPDLVLMDMNMPEVDGWEATRLIKADNSMAEVPGNRAYRPCDVGRSRARPRSRLHRLSHQAY